jgi:hypothetical protein
MNKGLAVEAAQSTMSEDGADTSPPSSTQIGRPAGMLLVAAGVLALAGNLLHPRFDGNDVTVYRQIAHSTRYAAADVILLAAFLLLTAGLATLATGLVSRSGRARPVLAELARLAVVVGGTLAIAQTTVELTGLRQQARTFTEAPVTNNADAFWATNSLDTLNNALGASWTLILIGVAPVLVILACRRLVTNYPLLLAIVGLVGGVTCAGVAIYNLVSSESSNADIPFLVGSLLVTAWVMVTGWWATTTVSTPTSQA